MKCCTLPTSENRGVMNLITYFANLIRSQLLCQFDQKSSRLQKSLCCKDGSCSPVVSVTQVLERDCAPDGQTEDEGEQKPTRWKDNCNALPPQSVNQSDGANMLKQRVQRLHLGVSSVSTGVSHRVQAPADINALSYH